LSSAARDEQLYYQARYDALTGLPNRLYFKDELAQELVKAARAQTCVAVLFIDLDHFKDVNDTAGHSAGDVLLQEIAARLKRCTRESDFIARLGGDEFTILLPGVTTPDSAGVFADKVVQAMAQPFLVEGHERFLSASVGIAVYPHDGTTADALVKNADTAMYRAKSTGRNKSVYFEDRMNAEARARVALERELRRAIAQAEFELHYQPQLDLRSGEICGAEALLRWNHPERGLLLPSHFVGLAEEVGLIEPLGRWILDRACAQYKVFMSRGIRLKRFSVNVSARQFRQSDFVDFVTRTVAKHNVLPLCFELEITESLLMSANEEVDQALRALKDLGIRLAIDDFGTGYSSLAYLKQFSFDVVKIDKSFVRDLEANAESRAITSAIVAMAHALRKEVVAEGVETEGQLAILRNLACDQIQGYFFAEALAPQAFMEFAAARRAIPALRQHALNG
jgi:diguanylate cyclase (GGDEF)-like protein